MDELIVHDIPMKLSRRVLRETPTALKEQPVFSQIASPVNSEIVNFFHDRITSSLGSSSAVDVVFDPENESPVRRLIYEYFFEDQNRRIQITQKIAQHLFVIQNAQNSSGLLLFLCCQTRGNDKLAILKVEREEGVRVIQQIVQDGLRTFDVEHIRDLMLTAKTKLFKIVLFYSEGEIIKGILCDQQRGYDSKDVAEFFISKFLGCMLTEEPQILTKVFFEVTQEYINKKIESPEQKGVLINHLFSELTNQVRTINLAEFARRVLTVEQRDDYLLYIKENGVTVGSFSKDCTMIESKLKKIQIVFNCGISIVGSQDAFGAKSSFSDTEDGEMKFEITDKLKQVKAK